MNIMFQNIKQPNEYWAIWSGLFIDDNSTKRNVFVYINISILSAVFLRQSNSIKILYNNHNNIYIKINRSDPKDKLTIFNDSFSKYK